MPRTITKIAFPQKPQTRTKVAAYARVSSGKDAMLHSLSAQVSYYISLIQSNPKWEYVGVYADEAITGTKNDRDNFQRLISDCQDGKIDLVITKSISRFARNTVTLLETVRMLKTLAVDVYFEEQNIHTMSADGELMLTILASYAQEESRSASENQKWRIKRNFEEGLLWGTRMYGYRLVDNQYVIEPREAKVVKRIFDEYLGGYGVDRICKSLRDSGIPPISADRWYPQTIAKMLRNYNYTGNLILQKTYRDDHLSKKVCINDGQLPRYHVANTHEAIIDMDTFDRVQEEIGRRAEKYRRCPAPVPKYPFTSLVVCAKCGKNYHRKTTHAGPVWICVTFAHRGKDECASKQIPEKILTSVAAEVTENFSDIKRIEADDGNVLRFYLKDGTMIPKIWRDRSRSNSWTVEKREQARQRAFERSKVNGKNGNGNPCHEG